MPAYDFTRRASYGPTSPAVGERGARTRQRIIDVTLSLFEEKGFHATLVDDIAGAAGISRAALYQYFESKEDIFIELLRDCGAALLRVIPRLGPLGPTAEGYDNLREWLGEWGGVYEKYSTMFIQWAHVDSPKAPLRPLVADFLGEYTRRMVRRLRQAAIEGIDPQDLAIALLATVNRVNYHRSTGGGRGLSDDELLDALATVFQLVLYPSTPSGALAHPRAAAPAGGPVVRRSRGAVAPLPGAAAVPGMSRAAAGAGGSGLAAAAGSHRAEGLSDRVRATVGRLLDAGADVFASHGYHQASVDDVVRQAGLGRGTFYKYFDDKLDLLTVLAEDCARDTAEMSDAFGRSAGRGGAELRGWLVDFVALHRHYMGVFRVWVEGAPHDPAVQAVGMAVTGRLTKTFDEVLGGVQRRHELDARAASLILLALLERLPSEVLGTRWELPPERLVETMATMIERSLLNAGAAPPAPAARPRRTPGPRRTGRPRLVG